MLKYAAAMIIGIAVLAPPALAAPRDEDCVNCAPPKPYDSEDPARIRQEMDRPRAPEVNTPAPPSERAPYAERAGAMPARDCADCPPPKRYDNTEVVKTSRDVDQSRVINTEEVVQVPPRVKETNKLIVHENEIRNVGVVQHNHQIIEKEVRYVRRPPAYRPASAHRVVPRVQLVYVPVVQQPVRSCGCSCSCGSSGYGAAYAYAPGYAYGAGQGYVQQQAYVQQQGYVQQQVWVPVNPQAYAYR